MISFVLKIITTNYCACIYICIAISLRIKFYYYTYICLDLIDIETNRGRAESLIIDSEMVFGHSNYDITPLKVTNDTPLFVSTPIQHDIESIPENVNCDLSVSSGLEETESATETGDDSTTDSSANSSYESIFLPDNKTMRMNEMKEITELLNQGLKYLKTRTISE